MAKSTQSLKRAAYDIGGQTTIREVVDRLTELENPGDWVVSCYLKLEPRDRTRGKYLIKLKNRIKEHVEWMDDNVDMSRRERTAVGADLDRVRQYVEVPGNLPVGQGLAIFASQARRLFEAVPLPMVFRSRVAVARGPLVREMVALDDEFGLMLCALVDRNLARFFTVTAFGVEESSPISIDEEDVDRRGKFRARRTGSMGSRGLAMPGEHNFHQRIKEEKHRHYAHVAQRLFSMARSAPVRGIVLGGVGSAASAVEPHLHPYLRDLMLGSAKLNPQTASASDVVRGVLKVRRDKEREWEAAHVQQLAGGLGNRWAVNGVEATLAALARGQVRTLLVAQRAVFPGFRCGETGRLTTVDSGCLGQGELEPVPDAIDDAIEDALNQGCQVDVIDHDAPEVEGLAALLRFPLK